MASNAENVSIWWRHHGFITFPPPYIIPSCRTSDPVVMRSNVLKSPEWTAIACLWVQIVISHLHPCHYSDVIMSTIASQITGVLIVCSTVWSGADQRKHQSSASLAFVRGNPPVTCGLPSQMANNAENVYIWWRHREWSLWPFFVLRMQNPTHFSSKKKYRKYGPYLIQIHPLT